ncbi:MAG: complex I subunit 5 family protein [Nitrospinota bacterium]
MSAVVVLPVVGPLGVAIALLLLRRSLRLQQAASLGAMVAYVALAALLLSHTGRGAISVHRMGLWPFPYGIILVADALSSTMLLLAAVVVGACTVFAFHYLEESMRREVFFPLVHFLLMGINGAFLTGDIFNLFVFFEVLLISAYALLSFYGSLEQLEMAFKYVAINLIGSTLFLLGVALLYAQVGTVNMADLSEKVARLGPRPLLVVTALIFLMVFSIKAAIFPMQIWLPSAHSISPTPIAAILAGIMVKVGIYAILRCATLIFPGPVRQLAPLLLLLAVITIAFGAIGVLPQRNLKRVLAYSTINQLGYILFGLSLLTPAGVSAALFALINHAFIKSSLLLGAGLTHVLTGSGELDEMGGLQERAPAASLLLLLGFLALAGFPPMNGFFSKLFLIAAGFGAGAYVATSLALGLGLVTLYYCFVTWQRIAWGTPVETRRAPLGVYLPVAFLVSFTVLFSLGAGPLAGFTDRLAAEVLEPALYVAAVKGAVGP